MDNMGIWKQVCTTKPSNTKQVSFGRKFTAINAQSQLEAATEVFGPCGIGWWIEDEDFDWTTKADVCIYSAFFKYKYNGEVGTVPLHATINTHDKKGKWDEDCDKKVATDALTKGLSKVGFSADIFLGYWDDQKYVNAQKEAEKVTPPANVKPLNATAHITTQLVDKLKVAGIVNTADVRGFAETFKIDSKDPDNNNLESFFEKNHIDGLINFYKGVVIDNGVTDVRTMIPKMKFSMERIVGLGNDYATKKNTDLVEACKLFKEMQ